MKMHKRTVVSLIIIGIAVAVSLVACGVFGVQGAGFIILYVGLPLGFIGLINLFSPISALIIFVGAVMHFMIIQTMPQLLAQDSGAVFLKYVGPVIIMTGALYGFIEGLLKATHHVYKPPVD